MLNVPASWHIATPANATPFAAGEHGRPLRIVVDHATINSSRAADLLKALAYRPRAQIISTDPAAPQRLSVAPEPNAWGATEIELTLGESRIGTGVYFAGGWPAQVQQAAEATDRPVGEIRRILILAQLTGKDGYDGLVTEAPLWQQPQWRASGFRAKVMDPAEALALVGLYLRAHGDWTVSQDQNVGTFLPAEAFYRATATGLIPPYRDWIAAATAAWKDTGNPLTFELTEAIVERVARSLRARDFLQVRLRHPYRDEAWEEVLFFLDALLVSLSGALDSIASLAHHAYRLPGDPWTAGWRRRRWTQDLARLVPKVAQVIEANRRSGAVIDLLAALRNSIHGPALSAKLHEHGEPQISDFVRTALAFDREEADRIRAALAVLAPNGWGALEHGDGTLLVPPGRLAEAAVIDTADVATELLMAMDQARLAGGLTAPLKGWLPDDAYRANAVLLAGPGSLDRSAPW